MKEKKNAEGTSQGIVGNWIMVFNAFLMGNGRKAYKTMAS